MDRVSVAFGGVRAVNEVSLEVPTGGFVGLVGPNGSGKTTFLNALTGVVPARGRLEVDGRRVRLGSPHSARKAGILRVFQAPQVIGELTCLENVTLSSASLTATGLVASTIGRPWMLRRERERWDKAARALAEVGLSDQLQAPASGLTYGQRRLLDLGGQGAAEAALFAAAGAQVVIGDVLEVEGKQLAHEIGDRAIFTALDVTRPDDWAHAVQAAEDEFGGLDVLVNNAGIVRTGTLDSMPLADYRAVVDVNQVGCFLGMQAVVAPMRRAGGGSIVNISSVAGLKGVAGVIGYVASKWAIRGMTKAAALELGIHGIRVNSVHPGTIDTDMVNGPEFADVDRKAFFKDMPIPRIGVPDDISSMVAFLASDASSYCTGSEFVVDGGDLAGTPVARS
ncbi:MAG TPA: SDR family oxidoreductase [Mycobacteriales bacterium]|nr:SDR family oxidoreductase [Mycobacteriales bacterium]